MRLTENEKLLKEWDAYSYGKGSKKTECSLILTSKRMFIKQHSKKELTYSEIPLKQVKSWSMKSEHSSGTAWLVLGILLCITIVGAIFGVICIVKGINKRREGAFAFCVRTKRKDYRSLRSGKDLFVSGAEKTKSRFPFWEILLLSLLFLLLTFLDLYLMPFPNSYNFRMFLFALRIIVNEINSLIFFIYLLKLLFGGRRSKKGSWYKPPKGKIKIHREAVREIIDEFGALVVGNQTA